MFHATFAPAGFNRTAVGPQRFVDSARRAAPPVATSRADALLTRVPPAARGRVSSRARRLLRADY